jgi:MFS family permease
MPTPPVRALVAVLASLFVGSIGLGMTSPLLGLVMNAAGFSGTVIGLNTAMFAVAIVLFAPIAPRLMRHWGSAVFLIASLAISAVMLLVIRLFEPGWIWFPIRLFIGCGFAGLWVVSESAINQLATERRRGLLIGIYSTMHTLGFAGGAFIIQEVGIAGWTPFMTAAGSMAAAALPILLVRRLPPPAVEATRTHLREFLRLAPFIVTGALVFGIVDLGVLAMLPVYGVRAGLPEAAATQLLVAAQVANPLVQIPLGLLADRASRRALLLGMAVLGIAAAAALAPSLGSPALRIGVLVVMGGALFAIYSLSLVLLGQRFSGTRLAEANAAFVFMYGVGSLIGPPAAGLAMDLWNPNGLPGFLVLVCAVYLVLGLATFTHRRTQP